MVGPLEETRTNEITFSSLSCQYLSYEVSLCKNKASPPSCLHLYSAFSCHQHFKLYRTRNSSKISQWYFRSFTSKCSAKTFSGARLFVYFMLITWPVFFSGRIDKRGFWYPGVFIEWRPSVFWAISSKQGLFRKYIMLVLVHGPLL